MPSPEKLPDFFPLRLAACKNEADDFLNCFTAKAKPNGQVGPLSPIPTPRNGLYNVHRDDRTPMWAGKRWLNVQSSWDRTASA